MKQRSLRLPALLGASGLLMLAALYAIYLSLSLPHRSSVDSPSRRETAARPAPEPEAFRFRPGIDAQTAEQINAAVPQSDEPLVAARPFALNLPSTQMNTKLSAVDCLTAAVYYEAASETLTGQRAVAQVVLNRMRHPAYPNSVCGVVFQGSQRKTGCQFTFTCDGSLNRRPSASGWARARAVAAAALSGYVEPSVGLATHYHTLWVVPYWSANLTKLRTVGSHIFYRWSGRSGTRSAFVNPYANAELLPASAVTSLSGYLLETSGALPLDPAIADGDAAASVPAVQTGLIAPPRGELSSAAQPVLGKGGSELAPTDSRLKTDASEHRLLEDQAPRLNR